MPRFRIYYEHDYRSGQELYLGEIEAADTREAYGLTCGKLWFYEDHEETDGEEIEDHPEADHDDHQ